jgi:DNA ligase-1
MEFETVNKKIIKYNTIQNRKILPILRNETKLGAEQRWQVEVFGNAYQTSSYQHPNGKVRVNPPVYCNSKNVGRSNETTPEQQALFEAKSKWDKQKKVGYVPLVDSESDTGVVEEKLIIPMKANKCNEKHLNPEEIYVSPKLDGVRCIASLKDQGEVQFTSRSGKHFPSNLQHIVDNVSEILKNKKEFRLDGELYIHNYPFSKLSGMIRSKNKIHSDFHKIEYHVFDLIPCDKNKNLPWPERLKVLNEIDANNTVKIVPSLKISTPEDSSIMSEIDYYHNLWVQDGYEGLIIRNPEGVYEHGKRSKHLMKYKMFEDSEFKIVDIISGVGTEEGACIYVCEHNGLTFNVRPRGTMEERREIFETRSSHIGKKLTVRYKEIQNVPREPVGIAIRDYE